MVYLSRLRSFVSAHGNSLPTYAMPMTHNKIKCKEMHSTRSNGMSLNIYANAEADKYQHRFCVCVELSSNSSN